MKNRKRYKYAGLIALVLTVTATTVNNLISGSNWSNIIKERNISVAQLVESSFNDEHAARTNNTPSNAHLRGLINTTNNNPNGGASTAVTSRIETAESFDFEIIVLTMDRADALHRLLDLLEDTDYGNDRVRLTIQIDHSKKNAAAIELAETFAYTHGPKVVRVAPTNRGLRAAWLEAWEPPLDGKHHAIIFEDDLEVSPAWYQYVKKAWETYHDARDIAGISLNRQRLIADKAVNDFEIVNNHEPFLYKLVGSQGFSPHPEVWRQFLEFCRSVDLNTFGAVVPGLITTEWYSRLPKRGMWTQLFIYFCEQHNLYNLYVNLPDKKALVSHLREKGEHFDQSLGADFAVAETLSLDNLFPASPVKYGWDGKIVKETDKDVATAQSPPTTAQLPPKLEKVGSEYGGWTYDASILTADSIVYSVGLGEDTSWDEGIMKKHGLHVWGCDPTPKSLKYVEARKELETGRFHLIPEGLSTEEGTLTFTLPKNPDHVSMRQGEVAGLGDTVEVKVNKLENWMKANNHTHLSILKIDIEGSEYEVLEDWIKRDFFPMDQLLVEWHFRWLPDKSRHDRVMKGLEDHGWYLAHSQNNGQEQLFLRKERKYAAQPETKPPTVSSRPVKLETTGSEYGGWTYDASKLNPDSIVYSIGLGEDTSWDEGIMEKHKVKVFGFDPTPKSIQYVQSRKQLKTNLFHFQPEGLSTYRHRANFTLPENQKPVSMWKGGLFGSGRTVMVWVNTLENWMKVNGHMRLAILKMDIEGSEYDVIEDWLKSDFFPMDQLLVEWHFRWLDDKTRHDRIIQGLKKKGWYVAHSQNGGQEQTFLRSTPDDKLAVNKLDELESSFFDKDFTDRETKTKLLEATTSIMKEHDVVAIQLLNEGYVEMTTSWICNVKHFPGVLDRTLFIATDKGAYSALTKFDTSLNVIHVDYQAPKDLSYGQYAYYAFMLFRTRLICYLLANDVTLWLIESDAVWIEDPSAEVLSTEGDMVTMSDGKPPMLILQGGFQLLRPTTSTLTVWTKLLKQFANTMKKYRPGTELSDAGSEQLMMNKLIRAEPNLHFSWLEPSHYFPGIYYKERDYRATAKKPKVILNNYIIGNDAKIKRAKEWGHWFVKDGTCDENAAKVLSAK